MTTRTGFSESDGVVLLLDLGPGGVLSRARRGTPAPPRGKGADGDDDDDDGHTDPDPRQTVALLFVGVCRSGRLLFNFGICSWPGHAFLLRKVHMVACPFVVHRLVSGRPNGLVGRLLKALFAAAGRRLREGIVLVLVTDGVRIRCANIERLEGALVELADVLDA